jgi:hypothetical protein
MSRTYSKQDKAPKSILIKSKTEDVVIEAPNGHLVLPATTDFSACSSALNAQVDLSGKQDANARLSQIANLAGTENKVLKFNSMGQIVEGDDNEGGGGSSYTFNDPLSENAGVVSLNLDYTLQSIVDLQPYSHGDFLRWQNSGGYDAWTKRTSEEVLDDINAQARNSKLTNIAESEPNENDIYVWDGLYLVPRSTTALSLLKTDDIGTTVQAYNANYLTSDQIGVDVAPHNPNYLTSSDIGVSVSAHNDNYLTSDQIGVDIQAQNSKLNDIANLNPSAYGDLVFYDGTNLTSATKATLNIQTYGDRLEEMKELIPASGEIYYYNGSVVSAGSKASLNIQETNARLDQFINLGGNANKFIKFNVDGLLVEADATAPSNVVYTDQDSTISSTLTASNLVVSSYQQWKNAGQASFTDKRVYNNTASNDTEKSIAEYPLPNNQLVYIVKVVVNAFSSSGNYAQHELKGVVNNGSFVSGSYRQSDIFDDLALTELKMDVNTSTLRVRVRSHASQNVRFHSVMEINAVEAISA